MTRLGDDPGELDSGRPNLLPVTDEHADLVLEIFASSVEETITALGLSPEQRHQFVTMQSSLQIAGYEQTNPDAEYYIISAGDHRVGRLIIEWSATALHLVDIALLPAARSGGIGSALIRNLQQQAAGRNLPLRLSVRVDNLRATALYERLDFVYSDSADHGNVLYRVMEWKPSRLLPGCGAS